MKKQRIIFLLVSLIMALSFHAFSSADTMEFPKGLTTIQTESFEGDTNLDKVILPFGISSIGVRAFANSGLTQINLPESITFIGRDAFPANVKVAVTPGTYAYTWAKYNGYIQEILATDLYLSRTSVTMNIGDKLRLYALISPADVENNQVSWSSSNDDVVSVDDYGMLSANGAGSAVIYATTTDGTGIRQQCDVTVNTTTIPVKKVTINKSALELTIDETETLTAEVFPADATNKTVLWTTDNIDVISVSSTGTIFPRSAGAAIVKAYSADNYSMSNECLVTVKEPIIQNLTIDRTTAEMTVGDQLQLITNTNASWISSKSTVASVDSSTGKVTAKAAGTAVITATSTENPGLTASCTITVKKKVVYATSVYIGDEGNLYGEVYVTVGQEIYLEDSYDTDWGVLPSGADQMLNFASADPGIAYVDYDGMIRGVSAGTTYVTGTTRDGTNLKVTWFVTVMPKIQSLTLDKHEITIAKGSNARLKVTSSPAVPDPQMKWTVNTTYVSKPSFSAGKYKMKAKATGTVTVTVSPDDGGNGSGDSCTIHIVDSESLSAPSNVIASLSGSNQITVSWNNDPLIETYTVYCSIGPWQSATYKKTVETTLNSITFGGIRDGKDHYIVVIGTSYSGDNTPMSEEKIVRANQGEDPVVHVTGVNITGPAVLTVGVNGTLTADILPYTAENRKLSWSSSKSSVVSVNWDDDYSNTVTLTPKAEGTAVIYAYADDDYYDAYDSVTVTVQKQAVPVTNVTVSPENPEMEVGETKTLTASITPSGATNKTIHWQSMNTSIATVSPVSGTSTTVTARGGGYVTIQAISGDTTNGTIVGESVIHVNGGNSYEEGPTITLDIPENEIINMVSPSNYIGAGYIPVGFNFSVDTGDDVHWTVSDPNALEIETDGNSVSVTANPVTQPKLVMLSGYIGVNFNQNIANIPFKILDNPVITVNGLNVENKEIATVDAATSGLTITWTSGEDSNPKIGTAILNNSPNWNNDNEKQNNESADDFINRKDKTLTIPQSLLKQYAGQWIKFAVGAYDTEDGEGKQAWTVIAVQIIDSTVDISGYFNTHSWVLKKGETYQLTGKVSVSNSELAAVRVTVHGYPETQYDNNFMYLSCGGFSSVDLGKYSNFIIDTNRSPFNQAGNYRLKLYARETGGTGTIQELDNFYLEVKEPEIPTNLETQILQVHLYDQGNSDWSGTTITTSTIGSVGCALTSVAMTERYRNNDDETITPLTILKTYKFTTQDGSAKGNNINWDHSSYTNGQGHYKRLASSGVSDDVLMQHCYDQLNSLKPLVVGLNTKSNGGGNTHYVVVYGYENLDPENMQLANFLVRDPAAGKRKNLQQVKNDYYFREVLYYTGAARVESSGYAPINISRYITFAPSGFIAKGEEVTSNTLNGTIVSQTNYPLNYGIYLPVPFYTDPYTTKVSVALTSIDGQIVYNSGETTNFTNINDVLNGSITIKIPDSIKTDNYLLKLSAWQYGNTNPDISARVKVRILDSDFVNNKKISANAPKITIDGRQYSLDDRQMHTWERNGSGLQIKWNGTNGTGNYKVRILYMNSEPHWTTDDSDQAEKTYENIVSNTSMTISASDLAAYSFIKIAVGTQDINYDLFQNQNQGYAWYVVAVNTIDPVSVSSGGNMTVSNSLIEYIKIREGKHLTAYNDPAGIPTIGWGHTGGVTSADVANGRTITVSEAEAYLRADLRASENKLNTFMKNKGVVLNQNQFDAIVSLLFNVNENPLSSDKNMYQTLLQYKNGSSIPVGRVYRMFVGYHHAAPGDNDTPLYCMNGLFYRRIEEGNIFYKGDYTVRYDWRTDYDWYKHDDGGHERCTGLIPDEWYPHELGNEISYSSQNPEPVISVTSDVVGTDNSGNGRMTLTFKYAYTDEIKVQLMNGINPVLISDPYYQNVDTRIYNYRDKGVSSNDFYSSSVQTWTVVPITIPSGTAVGDNYKVRVTATNHYGLTNISELNFMVIQKANQVIDGIPNNQLFFGHNLSKDDPGAGVFSPAQTGRTCHDVVYTDSSKTTGLAVGTKLYAPYAGRYEAVQVYTTINNVNTLTSFGNRIAFFSSDGKVRMLLAHMDSFAGGTLKIPSTRTVNQSGKSGSYTIITKDYVPAGTLLGTSGNTGHSDLPHVHFEIQVFVNNNWERVYPDGFFRGKIIPIKTGVDPNNN